MPSDPCPKCSKSNLTRCKILRPSDPDYGREYEACSHCAFKWFLDQPNRPVPEPGARAKKTIWERFATWGAPGDTTHPATYIFPKAHEYPPVVLPITTPLRPSFAAAAPPPAGPSLSEAPPPPSTDSESVRHSPKPAGSESVKHSPKPTSAHDLQPSAAATPLAPPAPSPKPSPKLPSEPVISQPDPSEKCNCIPTAPPTPVSLPLSSSPIDEAEERERYEMLMRIAKSPAKSPGLDDLPEMRSDPPPVEHGSDRSPVNCWQEQELREKLMKVIATPLPMSPIIYVSHIVTPIAPITPAMDDLKDFQDEMEVAAYAKRIAQRLEEAILKSPLLRPDTLLSTPQSPMTQYLAKSPHPAPSHNITRLPSRVNSNAPTPRQVGIVEDQVPLPGTFIPRRNTSEAGSVTPTPPVGILKHNGNTRNSTSHVGRDSSGSNTPASRYQESLSGYSSTSQNKKKLIGKSTSGRQSPLFG